MRKRIFSSLLLAAASFFVVSSVFVSCKDYDDDINANAAEIRNAQSLISDLQAQLTTLQSAAGTAQSTADAARQAAADAAAAAAAAQKTGDDAVAAAKTAQATAEAAATAAADAKVAAIAEATKMVQDLKSEVETLLASKVDTDVYNQKMGEIDLKLAQLEGQIAGIEESLNKLGEDVKANASEISTAKEAIATLSANQADMAIQIAALEEYKQSLESDVIPGLRAAIEANGLLIDGIQTTIAESVEKIEGVINGLSEGIAKNAQELVAVNAAVSSLNDKVGTLEDDITAINLKLTDLQTLIDENDEAVNKKIDDAVENLQEQIDALLQIKDENGNMTGLVDYLKNYTDTKLADYLTKTEIETKLSELENKFYDELTALALVVSQNKNEITAVLNSRLATLHILVAQRLTSMVYAPTTYVDGIEAITFATLRYTDWGTNPENWEQDGPNRANNEYVIDDALTEAVYHVSPSGVSLADIESLDFIFNDAKNLLTRAGGEAPIVVADKKLSNGKLVLNLKKTGETSFGVNKSEFTIVALKAKLAENVLTDDEKKAGKEVNVYSDWARLYETSETPYIHNKTSVDEAGNIVEGGDAHFWSYSEVYNGGKKTVELPGSFYWKNVAKEVIYNESYDLMNLVEICDKKGNIYDAEKYGLKFEFNLMDYTYKNEGQTVDATNQKYFAKIDGSIITPTSRDGQAFNRNAIGRTPMVQVVLKDVRDPENEKVVDVRYFKIAWTDKQEVQELGQITEFEEDYECGETYDLKVLEEDMNKIYAALNMSRDEFHNTYELRNEWLFNEEDVVRGNSINGKLGEIWDKTDMTDPGQTHNLLWTYDAGLDKATQVEYEAGKKVVTAYGCYVNKANKNNLLIFSVKLTLNIKKMELVDGVGHDQTMWANGERNINPGLETDPVYGLDKVSGTSTYANTQLRGNFLQGYLLDGKTPELIDDLVTYGTTVKFVFDADKLGEIAEATGTAATDWSVAYDGLTLNYKNVEAAIINGSDVYLAESNNGLVESKPTTGAKLLVGVSVPVKLDDYWCGLYQNIESYNVHFLTPLALEESTIAVTLTDITAGGSSAELKNKIRIKEDAVVNHRVVYSNYNPSGDRTNSTLMGWYGVEDVIYNIAKAKTNIQKNGSIGSACNVNLSDIQNADGSQKYTVSVIGKDSAAKVVFENKSGNAIGQEFKIEVPVTIPTKWQTLTTTMTITVKPGL